MNKIILKEHILQNQVYYLTNDYKTRNTNKNHNGMDFIGNSHMADYIIAIEKGRIITASYSKSAGYYVEIEHDNNHISRYLHLKKGSITVSVGQMVNKGQVIGYMGNTGDSTGVHLHFAIKKNNNYVDPLPYLNGEKRILETNINITYQIYDNKQKRWLPQITNYNTNNSNGYAGIKNSPIGGLRGKLSDNTIIRITSHIKGGNWLPEIKKWDETESGYSGIKGMDIDAIMIEADKHNIEYRVYTNKKWLPWVSGYSKIDYNNGYAGILGSSISAIQIRVIN